MALRTGRQSMQDKKNTISVKTKTMYKIGEITKLYGIGADSLRYYEKKGILQPTRGENGYRFYTGKDLLALNIIRNLRQLDFSVDQILQYFQNRTIDSTLRLLDDELEIIKEKRSYLEKMYETVYSQIVTINQALSGPVDEIFHQKLKARRIAEIEESYSTYEDFYLLMKTLAEYNGHPLYLIGIDKIGSYISTERINSGDFDTYDGVFIFDPEGKSTIPEGEYISIRYKGEVNNKDYTIKLKEYAKQNRLKLAGPFLEIIIFELHTTENRSEWMTELQIRVDRD